MTTQRLRLGVLLAGLGLTLLVAACSEAARPPRAAMSAADIVATATVRAGGAPGGAPPPPFADTSPGGQLFGTHCAACHAVKAGGGTVGPSLTTIATTAATRKPGTDAAAYIKESITTPNAVITQGYQANVMPGDFSQKLSAAQIDQLVAYLLEQK